jgi:purine-binding chemotaxis protein CheW
MNEDSNGGFSSRADSRASAQRSHTGSGPSARRETASSLCSFWIGERCFGLDTRLIGEVVTVEERIQIPLAPPAVRGIFNLRGEPVPLVSLAAVLKLAVPERKASRTMTAIVVRAADLVVGLIADRMEAVLPEGRGRLTPSANAEEDADFLGFLELSSDSVQTVVSVLNPEALLGHLAALRYLKAGDG